MNSFLTFANFKEGQYIKVSGKYFEEQGFVAVEAIVQPSNKSVKIESLLREVNLESRTFKILNHQFNLDCLEHISGLENERISCENLSSGTLVKIKGRYSETGDFVPKQLKVKKTLEFNVEEVEGKIEKVYREKHMLYLNKVPILFNNKSIIIDSEL